MEFIAFPQQTNVLGENQPEYQPLPVHVGGAPNYEMTFCMQLSEQEMDMMRQNGGRIYFTQLTFGNLFHPIRASLSEPA